MGQDIMLYLGAAALGALHAFEPGHGKTLIAAYMIGTRGRALDGIILGFTVTFTHTFSVLILGVVAKVLSTSYSDAELHAWLGLFSAILILAVGLWMLKQRLTGHGGHHHFHLFGKGHHHHDHHGHQPVHNGCYQHDDHHHHHDHDHAHDSHHHHDDDAGHHHHDHHDHPHIHDHGQKHIHPHPQPGGQPAARCGIWNLLVLGISGGLIPCPAAIATLLAAIAAGRTAQGLAMAIFFSLGLGMVMMSVGVALSQAGRLTEKIGVNEEFSRRMGTASALIITVLGAYTLYHSIKSIL